MNINAICSTAQLQVQVDELRRGQSHRPSLGCARAGLHLAEVMWSSSQEVISWNEVSGARQ